MKDKRALILIHPGFEEMEAIAPIDLLIRADFDVRLASTSDDKRVAGRGGVEIQATHLFKDAQKDELYDVFVVPGGPGIKALRRQPELCDFLRKHHEAGKLLACICAAPLLLLDAGLLPKHYTAHHSTQSELPDAEEKDYVWAGNILTSRGAGTATQFSLAIIEALRDKSARAEIAKSICWSE